MDEDRRDFGRPANTDALRHRTGKPLNEDITPNQREPETYDPDDIDPDQEQSFTQWLLGEAVAKKRDRDIVIAYYEYGSVRRGARSLGEARSTFHRRLLGAFKQIQAKVEELDLNGWTDLRTMDWGSRVYE